MEPSSHYVLGFNMPHGMDWIWIGLVMLLIFGSRLPSVMRNLGGSVREFKKGMEDPASPPPPATIPPAATPPAAPRVEGAVPRDGQPPLPPAAPTDNQPR